MYSSDSIRAYDYSDKSLSELQDMLTMIQASERGFVVLSPDEQQANEFKKAQIIEEINKKTTVGLSPGDNTEIQNELTDRDYSLTVGEYLTSVVGPSVFIGSLVVGFLTAYLMKGSTRTYVGIMAGSALLFSTAGYFISKNIYSKST